MMGFCEFHHRFRKLVQKDASIHKQLNIPLKISDYLPIALEHIVMSSALISFASSGPMPVNNWGLSVTPIRPTKVASSNLGDKVCPQIWTALCVFRLPRLPVRTCRTEISGQGRIDKGKKKKPTNATTEFCRGYTTIENKCLIWVIMGNKVCLKQHFISDAS